MEGWALPRDLQVVGWLGLCSILGFVEQVQGDVPDWTAAWFGAGENIGEARSCKE